MENALPTNIDALVAVAVISVLTPLLVALLTKPDAPKWLTGILSAVLAGTGAVTAYLVDIDGVTDWQQVLGVFVGAVVGAQGFRKGIDPGIETAVQDSTARFGISTSTPITGGPVTDAQVAPAVQPLEAAEPPEIPPGFESPEPVEEEEGPPEVPPGWEVRRVPEKARGRRSR